MSPASQVHPDDRVGAYGLRLLADPIQRAPPRLVPSLAALLELVGLGLAGAPRDVEPLATTGQRLPTNLEEAGAHDLRQGPKPALACKQKLVDRQVRGERGHAPSSRSSARRSRSLRTASSARSADTASIQPSRSSSSVFSVMPPTTRRLRHASRP